MTETEEALISLADVFEAYYECRRHKRSTLNALAFELGYETNLIQLWREINDGTYRPGPSVAFVVSYPVKREVFAALFRDRVVHHLIIRRLLPFFEAMFSPHSYSCRVGKGTQYAVQDIESQIRLCSHDYTRPCYVMKLDIQGFFMHIHHRILLERLESFIDSVYHGADKHLLKQLIRLTVRQPLSDTCFICGKRSDWQELPKSKSLFYAAADCGLPIGNLTSQIFANFYLHGLDAWIADTLPDVYYGRYVDDLVLVHESRAYLLACREKIRRRLADQFALTLHPLKFYLQTYQKGFPFVGTFLIDGRRYVSHRLKRHFYMRVERWRRLRHLPLTQQDLAHRIAVCNSYLGFLRTCQSYRLRRRIWHAMPSEMRARLV